MRKEAEFYVGYLPMPEGLKRTTRRVVIVLGALVLLVAATLIIGQQPFAASTFEFQQYREFRGTLLTGPYRRWQFAVRNCHGSLSGPGSMAWAT